MKYLRTRNKYPLDHLIKKTTRSNKRVPLSKRIIKCEHLVESMEMCSWLCTNKEMLQCCSTRIDGRNNTTNKVTPRHEFRRYISSSLVVERRREGRGHRVRTRHDVRVELGAGGCASRIWKQGRYSLQLPHHFKHSWPVIGFIHGASQGQAHQFLDRLRRVRPHRPIDDGKHHPRLASSVHL